MEPGRSSIAVRTYATPPGSSFLTGSVS
jgi:hypothetical protein